MSSPSNPVPTGFRVFIGNIPYSLTDDVLRSEAVAMKLSPVAVAVAKRQRDDKPLGFGFISFESAEEAEKAIAAFNKKTLGERVVRAESAYTEETSAVRKKFVLHVGNLPEVATAEDVANIFDGFKLVRFEVILDRSGKSKGFGYVGFETQEEMDRAIKTCKGTTVEDKEITLELARPLRKKAFRKPAPTGTTGSTAPAPFARKPRQPRPAATPMDATTPSEAPKKFTPKKPMRKRIPDEQRVKSDTVVHVGNLAFKAETGDVLKAFEKYEPVKVNVLRRTDGRSKGFAFVEFATPEAAQTALVMNEVDILGRKISCNIAFKQILPEASE